MVRKNPQKKNKALYHKCENLYKNYRFRTNFSYFLRTTQYNDLSPQVQFVLLIFLKLNIHQPIKPFQQKTHHIASCCETDIL